MSDIKYEKILEEIKPVDETILSQAEQKFQSLAMPLHSLGKLQDIVISLCGIQKNISPTINKRALLVFCADNGVVAQGVSQVGPEVTTAVAKSLCAGTTVMCQMANFANCAVFPVDIGMKSPFSHENLLERSINQGTADFTYGAAMSREDAIKSIEIGIELAFTMKEKGYQLLCTGEMGIGNTSTAAALTSVLLDLSPELVTGLGAGLSSDGFSRKKQVISQGITLNSPNKDDVIDVLSKVGGFDIGGMIGLMLGSAYLGLPCVVDGYISDVSAYCAVKLCPYVKDYLIFSHRSYEKGANFLLEKMNASPILDGNFRLGEGSGCMALLPLLDMGLALFQDGITFSEMNIDAYQKK